MSKIEISDLWFRFPMATEWALRGVSLRVEEGEFIAIMGPTGAGKTTLCHTLNGLIPHSLPGTFKGTVKVEGIDTKTSSVPDLAEKIGMTFQDLESQLFGLTVEEEVAFGPENLGVPRAEIGQRLDEVLNVVRLSEYRYRSPWELSGGQKQRVAIAAALALRPDILVMDEPTSELDPIGKREIFSVVETLREQHGITVILVEHEAEQIARFADRVIMMEDGQVTEIDRPRPFFTDILNRQTQKIRCPQVSEMAHILQKSGRWRSDTPIDLDEAIGHVSAMYQGKKSASESVPEELPPRQSAIEIRDLYFKYPNGVEALRGVSLDIFKGEVVAIIGQNGSGKTTLVKHFNGLLKPNNGSIKVLGSDIANQDTAQLAKIVGYSFQNPDHQIFCETVEEEISYGPRNLGLSQEEIVQVVDETLKSMNLERYRQEHPMSLGKGERKLVALCSVLSMRPEILVVDEPTTGQDYVNTLRIADAIKRYQNEGKTVILVTHDMRLVANVAQRTVVMIEGTVLSDTSTRVAFKQPEMLKKSFIEPPQIVALCNALADRGFPSCLTVSEVTNAIECAVLQVI